MRKMSFQEPRARIGTRLAPVALGLLLTCVGAAHAQRSGSASVTGEVRPAYRAELLAISAPSGASVRVESLGLAELAIFTANSTPGSQPVVLRIALRTNAPAYRLLATAADSSAPLAAATTVIAATGARTAPESVSSFAPISTPFLVGTQTIARGTRISTEGRFTDADNAILIEMTLLLPAKSTGSVRLSMGS